MSTPVKLASALPSGNANGLGALVGELVDNPTGLQVVIAIVDTSQLKTIVDTGEVVPVVRVRRIEALTGMDRKAGRTLFRRAFFKRTGKDTLPLEMEDEINEAFGAPDGIQTSLETDR